MIIRASEASPSLRASSVMAIEISMYIRRAIMFNNQLDLLLLDQYALHSPIARGGRGLQDKIKMCMESHEGCICGSVVWCASFC